MKNAWIGLALLGLITASSATAQGWKTSIPRATLYELPGFQGRQMTVLASGDNLATLSFNDIAQSARFEGRWRICEDARFRGRCRDVAGEVADLAEAGMTLKVSSLQGYQEGAWDRRDVDGGRPQTGARNVLFAFPNAGGFDLSGESGSADRFCRMMGLGSAAYFDNGERAPRALDQAGRYVGETSVLRDVLCRRF